MAVLLSQVERNWFNRQVALSEWAVKYEANALPAAATPAWTKAGTAATEENSPAGYLHIVSSTNGTGISYTRTETSLDNSIGMTLEFRLKVISADTVAGAGFYPSIQISDGTNDFGIDIFSDQIYLTTNYTHNMDTTDDYHTYRITYQGTNVKVYVDGVLVINHPSFGNTNASKTIAFWPEYAGVAGCETSWNYVYYRTNGAIGVAKTTVDTPINELKKRYYKSQGAAGNYLAELEKGWLRIAIAAAGGTPAGYRNSDLWKQLLAASSLNVSQYEDQNKMTYYLNT